MLPVLQKIAWKDECNRFESSCDIFVISCSNHVWMWKSSNNTIFTIRQMILDFLMCRFLAQKSPGTCHTLIQLYFFTYMGVLCQTLISLWLDRNLKNGIKNMFDVSCPGIKNHSSSSAYWLVPRNYFSCSTLCSFIHLLIQFTNWIPNGLDWTIHVNTSKILVYNEKSLMGETHGFLGPSLIVLISNGVCTSAYQSNPEWIWVNTTY